MKVSVILITYNHEKYIREAIESVLMQHINYDVEVIVADDCSTDETLDIIKLYESKTLFAFRYFQQQENIGLVKNYQRAFAAASSEYVAVLEGDDYWTDPYRLQKHIDFLDTHFECVMTYNRNVSYLQESKMFQVDNENLNTNNKYITVKNLASGNCIGNFSTCVYRKTVLDKIDPTIFNMNIADWMVNLAVAQYGLICQLGEIMSVYRVHNNGEWSKMNRLMRLKMEYDCAESYNKYFELKYNVEFLSLQSYIQSEIEKIENKKRFNWRSIKRYCPPIAIMIIKLFIPGCKK
jgi:glycosyltransferase involved in cell wall biosynthesis